MDPLHHHRHLQDQQKQSHHWFNQLMILTHPLLPQFLLPYNFAQSGFPTGKTIFAFSKKLHHV